MSKHWLENKVYVGNGKNISFEELEELDSKVNFEKFFDYEYYEYNGNHYITKDGQEAYNRESNMCCGMINETIELSNGEVIYYGFDYGH